MSDKPQSDSNRKDEREWAETLALKALTFVLSDETLRNRFLAISGVLPNAIEDELENPAFLSGVLDFLLANERDLMAFCQAAGHREEDPKKAHWTLVGILH